VVNLEALEEEHLEVQHQQLTLQQTPAAVVAEATEMAQEMESVEQVAQVKLLSEEQLVPQTQLQETVYQQQDAILFTSLINQGRTYHNGSLR
jgi:hypothetical protein